MLCEVISGTKIVTPRLFVLQLVTCDSPAGKLGVTVCYDLRFPEMYQLLAWHMGAQIMLVPSAFTVATGKHGKLLTT